MCAASAAAPIVSSELSGRALRLFSTAAACGASSCQAGHVGGSSGVAGLPGGFCCGLQQAGGQFRKSEQVRARCRAAGVAYQRVRPRPAARPARPRSAKLTWHFLPSPVIAGCGGDGVVDEGGGDGGGGGEGVGVEDPGAGRGAVDEQRELLAELFRVGGAGFAGGVGEPRGDGFLCSRVRTGMRGAGGRGVRRRRRCRGTGGWRGGCRRRRGAVRGA